MRIPFQNLPNNLNVILAIKSSKVKVSWSCMSKTPATRKKILLKDRKLIMIQILMSLNLLHKTPQY